MSAFADSSFASDHYHSARPTYPPTLYEVINEYHSAHSDSHALAVDVACGPGEATSPQSKYFDSVIGIDTSSVMINSARKAYPSLQFHVSKAETFVDTVGISPGTVDLVTVAEGIHWFDIPAFFVEVHRALKSGGTFAFWGYCDAAITDYPKASKAVLDLCYGKDALGPYWQQPGRTILRDRVPFEIPSNLFTDVERHENVVCGDNKPAVDGGSTKFVMKKAATVSAIKEYIRTWSAWHNWRVANPEADDILEACFKDLKSEFAWTDETELEFEWDTFLVLATQK